MKGSDKMGNIQEIRKELEIFRATYDEKYPNKAKLATVEDVEELARDVFSILRSIVDELEKVDK